MSKGQLKRQSSKFAERLELELLVAGTEFSDLERTVFKATKANTKVPKEKHVQKIFQYLHRGVSEKQTIQILKVLARRFKESAQGSSAHLVPGASSSQQNHWTLAKTLVVWHRILRSADRCFSERVAPYSETIFGILDEGGISHGRDRGSNMSALCHDYALHIKMKIQVNAKLRYVFDQEDPNLDPRFKSIPELQLFEEFPLLLKVLVTMNRCKIQGKVMDPHPAYQQLHELLLIDMRMLDRNFCVAIPRLTEWVKTEGDAACDKFIKIFRKYIDQVEKAIKWLESLPAEVNVTGGTMIETMKSRLMDVTHEDSPTSLDAFESWWLQNKSPDYTPATEESKSKDGPSRKTLLEKADEWDQGKHAWNKDAPSPNQPEQRIFSPASPTSPPAVPTMPKPEAKPEPSLINLMIDTVPSKAAPAVPANPFAVQQPFQPSFGDFSATPNPFAAQPQPQPQQMNPFGMGAAPQAPPQQFNPFAMGAPAPAAANPFAGQSMLLQPAAAPPVPVNPFLAQQPQAQNLMPLGMGMGMGMGMGVAQPSMQPQFHAPAGGAGLFLPAPANRPPPPAPQQQTGSLI